MPYGFSSTHPPDRPPRTQPSTTSRAPFTIGALMDWHYLGHAMWLADFGDLRILFDPLIDGVHHGGVFEVEPPRTVDVEALRPDFIVVSHQHMDHFDVPSLVRLAKLDPDAVIFTADELVADTARRVGFRTVAPVETFSRIDLDGVRLASTPSYTDEVEWGLMVEGKHGVVWNQIDSFHAQPAQIQDTLRTASQLFERDLTRGLPLALVRWQPVLEAQAPLAERPGFPYQEYAESLARIAAIRAQAVVPSAAGVRQTTPYAFMNHYVYPVPQRRVVRDLAARVPGTQVFPATIGSTYRVRNGQASYDPTGAKHLVTVRDNDPGPMATLFRPYELPALADPNLGGYDEEAMRARCEAWIRGDLAEGLTRAWPSMAVSHALRFVVEVVFPTARDAFTVTVDGSGATTTRDLDDDYDALTSIVGSMLFDVIEGRRSWGDPLLGGMLRASLRAYDIHPNGLAVAKQGAVFLYRGLPYAASVRRAIAHALQREGFTSAS